MPTEKENTATMQEALRSLNEVSSNIATPKTIKKNITDMVADLTNGQYSISVRAANAISMLDDVTQDPNMPSHVRVTLWQALYVIFNLQCVCTKKLFSYTF